jgi:hypothetical protein
MILIFSVHQDLATQKVIDWLIHFKNKPIIINEINPIVDITWEQTSGKTSHLRMKLKNGIQINSDDVSVVWYRKGIYFLNFLFTPIAKIDHLNDVYINLREEYQRLSEIIFDEFKTKAIGQYDTALPNKLRVLKIANGVGLNIPDTRIISNKEDAFACEHINKNISEIISTTYQGHILYNRTTLQSKYNEENFYPSLIQKYISKYCELRIFFFVDKFFTMAIKPVNGKSLEVDNRDITGATFYHRFNFELPSKIQAKLKAMFRILGYSTCSVDMIIDTEFNYHFLEINPVGQFSALSAFCNFNIEKYIATKLISYEKRNH